MALEYLVSHGAVRKESFNRTEQGRFDKEYPIDQVSYIEFLAPLPRMLYLISDALGYTKRMD